MHELGIVMKVIEQAENAARENNVTKVTKLTLEVGEVSTIVPALFRDCYEWAKKRTEFLQESELNLIILEGISFCRTCRKTYKTTEYAKECPYCHGFDTYLVTGNEIRIKDMEVI